MNKQNINVGDSSRSYYYNLTIWKSHELIFDLDFHSETFYYTTRGHSTNKKITILILPNTEFESIIT